jgi:hypothetical protein
MATLPKTRHITVGSPFMAIDSHLTGKLYDINANPINAVMRVPLQPLHAPDA